MRRSSGPSRPVSARSKARTEPFLVPRSTFRGEPPPGAPRSAERGTWSRALSSRRGQPADLRLGTHAVEEALRAGRAARVLVQRDLPARPRLLAIQALAVAQGVPVEFVAAAALDAMAGEQRHQGVAAEAKPFRYASLADVLDRPRAGDPFLLVLDGIEDPHNFGAILRSAEAAGVDGVVVAERRAAPVTSVVARASAGALDHVPVAPVVNLSRALEAMKERGVWVYGLDASGEVVFDEADYARPVAIVAGAEGKGLSRLVRETCDLLLRIPLYGHVESLNVSVATAVALFAGRRARDRAGGGT